MVKAKINPLGVGLTGAAVGLSVGFAAAKLTDKKKRQKALKTIVRIKDQAFDVAQNVTKRVNEMKGYIRHEPNDHAIKRVGRAYGVSTRIKSTKKIGRKRK